MNNDDEELPSPSSSPSTPQTPLQRVLSPIARRLGGAPRPQSSTEEETVEFRTEEEEADPQQDITGLEATPTSTTMASTTDASSPADADASSFNAFFGDGSRLTAAEIKTSMSVRSRKDRGSGKELQKLMDAATYALTNRAGVRRGMVLSNKDGELEEGNVSANEIGIAWEHAGRFVTELSLRIETYDMSSSIIIPSIVDDTKNPNDGKWGGSTKNLCKEVMSVDMETIKEFVKDIIECDKPGDAGLSRMDQKWLLLLLRKSCSSDLINLVDRTFLKLEPCYQGGTVFLKMIFDVIFAKSTSVIAALHKWIKNFEKKGLRKIPNGNVQYFSQIALVIVARLHEFDELPIDSDQDILRGLVKCDNNGAFVAKFELYLTMSNQTLFDVSSDFKNKSTFERIELILGEAVDFWLAAHVNDEWKITMHQVSACFNCGEDDHLLGDCPQEFDQEKIKKNKANFQKNKGTKGGTSGGDGDKQRYSRGKFRPPKVNESVRKISGVWYSPCKHCNAWTTTHSTGYHDDWSNNSTFCLPATHPLSMAVSGKPPGSGKSKNRRGKKDKQGTKSNSGTSGSDTTNSGGTANVMSALAKHMEKMETDSSDPRQAEMAGLIKALLSGKV